MADLYRKYRGTGKREVAREISFHGADSSAVRIGDLEGDGPSPSSRALAKEQAEAIQQALAGLPEEYCRAILMRNRERLSFAEIGKALGRSPEAARKLWTRAIEALQKDLGPDG